MPRPPVVADVHPNVPRRRSLTLAFIGIAVSGVLGGLIGYGLVSTTCSSTPTVAQHLLEQTRAGYHVHVSSCAPQMLGAAVLGTLMAAVGASVVAILILRAQSEWRGHPAPRVHRS